MCQKPILAAQAARTPTMPRMPTSESQTCTQNGIRHARGDQPAQRVQDGLIDMLCLPSLICDKGLRTSLFLARVDGFRNFRVECDVCIIGTFFFHSSSVEGFGLRHLFLPLV
jgi:hypothetical protein